jgi:hypothetical protein
MKNQNDVMKLILMLAVLLIAGIAQAQAVARVEKSVDREITFIAQPTQRPDADVTFSCTSGNTQVFKVGPVPLDRALYVMPITHQATKDGNLYTYSCLIEPNHPPPFSIIKSETRTVRVWVHDCSEGGTLAGWRWNSEFPNVDVSGICIQSQQQCDDNQICFRNGQNNLPTCIDAVQGACCAANSLASYTHREPINTY